MYYFVNFLWAVFHIILFNPGIYDDKELYPYFDVSLIMFYPTQIRL